MNRALFTVFAVTALLMSPYSQIARVTGVTSVSADLHRATASPATWVTRVVAGGSHACALTSSAGVKCWGSNSGGQLGDGTMIGSPAPVNVTGLSSGTSAIAAGGGHTCAITNGGVVKCWGHNGAGALGDGTWTARSTPGDVVGLDSGVSAIAAVSWDTCAITSGGGAKCWGGNYYGELGDGTTTDRWMPVDVSGLISGVIAIDLGDGHSCAIMSNASVKCWGLNWAGELGDGTTTQQYGPVDVIGLGAGASAIAAGGNHTCALTTGGGVKCWGANYSGQLGDGTNAGHLAPEFVYGLSTGVIAIDAGESHTCALTNGGSVKCWGENQRGQLGDGTTTNRSTPVDVPGLGNSISAIATGFEFTCALTTSADVECWGDNRAGQLGDATNTDRYSPVRVKGLPPYRTNLPFVLRNSSPSCDAFEPNDDRHTVAGGLISSGVVYQAKLCANDPEDNYRVQKASAGSLAISISLPAALLGHTTYFVYSTGDFVAPVLGCTGAGTAISTAPFAATCPGLGAGGYVLRLYSDPGVFDNNNSYAFSITY